LCIAYFLTGKITDQFCFSVFIFHLKNWSKIYYSTLKKHLHFLKMTSEQAETLGGIGCWGIQTVEKLIEKTPINGG